MKKSFPARLKTARETAKLTQAATAAKLGIQPTTYCNYEKGVREPNIEMLDRLASVFDVSIDYLLGRVNKPYLALLEDIPEEFHQEGVQAIEVAKSLIKEGLNSDQLNDLLIFVKGLNKKKK